MTITPNDTVLVTGASGFLGSYIVDSYLARRIPVKVMVRLSSDLTWLKRHVEAGKVTLAYGSMTDPASLQKAVEGVTAIVHVAAVLGLDVPREVYQRVNVDGTRVLVEAAVVAGVKRFTLISSVSTYGDGIVPGTEVTEETPQHPSNPYGESKLAQQQIVFEAYQAHGLPVVSLEPPVIYGPRARVGIESAIKVVKRGIVPLLDYGRGHINLVYVTDVVGALVAADNCDKAIGERFLVAGPRFTSHEEIFNLVAQSLGKSPLYFPVPLWATRIGLIFYNAWLRLRGKDVFLKPDYFYKFTKGANYLTHKAHKVLHWQPTVDITTGIPQTVAWFEAESAS